MVSPPVSRAHLLLLLSACVWCAPDGVPVVCFRGKLLEGSLVELPEGYQGVREEEEDVAQGCVRRDSWLLDPSPPHSLMHLPTHRPAHTLRLIVPHVHIAGAQVLCSSVDLERWAASHRQPRGQVAARTRVGVMAWGTLTPSTTTTRT